MKFNLKNYLRYKIASMCVTILDKLDYSVVLNMTLTPEGNTNKKDFVYLQNTTWMGFKKNLKINIDK